MNDARDRLLGLIGGFRIMQMVRAAALLQICDQLAKGPRKAPDVAAEIEADPALLRRLMRGLAGIGVLEELQDGRFSNTELGELLRTDVPGTLAPVVIGLAQDHVHLAWSQLYRGVREGTVPHQIANQASFWEVHAREPQTAARFNAFMVAQTEAFVPQLLDAFDFSECHTVVDVGVGNGGLIAPILSAHPELRGVLFDLEAGLAGAPEHLRLRGVADRCKLVTGDFFESVPSGGDACMLRLVLHDWTDQDAARILVRCREAMTEGAHLIVIDHLLPERADSSPEARGALMADLHMYVLFGAKERTEAEMRKMLEVARFEVERIALTSPTRTIVA